MFLLVNRPSSAISTSSASAESYSFIIIYTCLIHFIISNADIPGIDDVEIISEADLFKALDGRKVGDTVRIRLLRAVDASASRLSPSPSTLPSSSESDSNSLTVGATTISVRREELVLPLVLGQKAD